MRVLVTGAAGYVGSALTAQLVAQGHRVVAVDNDARRLGRLAQIPHAQRDIEMHGCDLEELVDDPRVLDRADAVVHLAGISSEAAAERDPERTWHVNVDLAARLAQAAKRAGVGTFVLASAAAIYQVPVGDARADELFQEHGERPPDGPVGTYARSKLAAEEKLLELRDDGFMVFVLRKGVLYGYSAVMRWDLVINRFTLNAWLGKPLTLHDLGAVWRPIVHVDDAARAYIHLMQMPVGSATPSTFNLVERNARMSEVCLEVDEVVRRELGRSATLQYGSSPSAQRTGRVSGEALRRAGWHPTRSLRDGVTELLERLRMAQVDPSDGVPVENMEKHSRV